MSCEISHRPQRFRRISHELPKGSHMKTARFLLAFTTQESCKYPIRVVFTFIEHNGQYINTKAPSPTKNMARTPFLNQPVPTKEPYKKLGCNFRLFSTGVLIINNKNGCVSALLNRKPISVLHFSGTIKPYLVERDGLEAPLSFKMTQWSCDCIGESVCY